MVPGTMSSLAVASTVSRSAAGSKGLRFVSDAAVPPKEHATATASAKIRVVMISLLGHADELTVGPPTSGYGTRGHIETSASGDSSPTGTHAGQAAPFWVEPFRLTPRGRNLAKKSDVGRFQDEAQRRDSRGRPLGHPLGRSLCHSLERAGGGGCVGAASQHRRALDRHAE